MDPTNGNRRINPVGRAAVPRQNSSWQNRRLGITPNPSKKQHSIIAELSGDDTCAAEGCSVRGHAPVLALCRSLIAAGLSPDAALQVFRNGVLALRIRSLAEGALLTVREDRSVPEFAPYRTAFALDGIEPPRAIEPEAAKHPRQAVEAAP